MTVGELIDELEDLNSPHIPIVYADSEHGHSPVRSVIISSPYDTTYVNYVAILSNREERLID